jgi:hypothetical protein
LLFQNGNAEDLADKLLTLLGNRELACKLGERGAEDIARDYAPDVVARRMAAFYQHVVVGMPHGRPVAIRGVLRNVLELRKGPVTPTTLNRAAS